MAIKYNTKHITGLLATNIVAITYIIGVQCYNVDRLIQVIIKGPFEEICRRFPSFNLICDYYKYNRCRK